MLALSSMGNKPPSSVWRHLACPYSMLPRSAVWCYNGLPAAAPGCEVRAEAPACPASRPPRRSAGPTLLTSRQGAAVTLLLLPPHGAGRRARVGRLVGLAHHRLRGSGEAGGGGWVRCSSKTQPEPAAAQCGPGCLHAMQPKSRALPGFWWDVLGFELGTPA